MVWIEPRQRATRYPVTTTLLFKERSRSGWRQAMTVNLSCTGVLFRTDGAVPDVGTSLDFILMLPINGREPTPELHGKGRIARVAFERLSLGGGSFAAMTIDSHTFDNRPPA